MGVLRLLSFLTFNPPGLIDQQQSLNGQGVTHPDGSRRGGGRACRLSPSDNGVGASNPVIVYVCILTSVMC
jgi:hypothetical protein